MTANLLKFPLAISGSPSKAYLPKVVITIDISSGSLPATKISYHLSPNRFLPIVGVTTGATYKSTAKFLSVSL